MLYDHSDSFSVNFERNEIPFGSKSNGKLSSRSYSIQFERNWKYSFLSVSVMDSSNRLSDRFTSLGIMGDNFRDSLETVSSLGILRYVAFQGVFHDTERLKYFGWQYLHTDCRLNSSFSFMVKLMNFMSSKK